MVEIDALMTRIIFALVNAVVNLTRHPVTSPLLDIGDGEPLAVF